MAFLFATDGRSGPLAGGRAGVNLLLVRFQRDAAIVLRFGVIGPQRDRPVKTGQGLLMPFEHRQRQAAIIPGRDQSGIHGHSQVESGQRLSRRATGGVAATSSAAAAAAARIAAAQAPVLVVCQDSFTCLQLREVLKAGGPATLLRRLYVDFLRRKWEGRRPGAAAADPGR